MQTLSWADRLKNQDAPDLNSNAPALTQVRVPALALAPRVSIFPANKNLLDQNLNQNLNQNSNQVGSVENVKNILSNIVSSSESRNKEKQLLSFNGAPLVELKHEEDDVFSVARKTKSNKKTNSNTKNQKKNKQTQMNLLGGFFERKEDSEINNRIPKKNAIIESNNTKYVFLGIDEKSIGTGRRHPLLLVKGVVEYEGEYYTFPTELGKFSFVKRIDSQFDFKVVADKLNYELTDLNLKSCRKQFASLIGQ